ncbi:MAG: hypothetical protein AB1Z98_30775, partial [Nannocystaceae bacterium]
MKLTGQNISHAQTLTHESKLLVVGTASDGTLYYAIRRSGYEASALADPDKALDFEDWQPLRTGDSVPDASVTAEEAKSWVTLPDENGDGGGRPILRSRYGADAAVTKSADAPVQLLSAQGYVYVFRQSPDNKILVNRFVLDGMTNQLVPKLEVRFRRSRQRLEPDASMTKKGNSLENVDSVDYRDIDGNSFYEPATELSFLGEVRDGRFAVVLVATSEAGVSRWHFAVVRRNALVLYSVLASDVGLFEIHDHSYAGKDPTGKVPVVYRTIPGVVMQTISLAGASDSTFTISGPPAMITYDVQNETVLDDGTTQLMRGATRVMLTVPVADGQAKTVAALSLGIGADGQLAQPTGVASSQILRSKVRDVLLPLDTLDGIKSFADTTPPPSGTIGRCQRGEEDKLEIYTSSDQLTSLEEDDSVQLRGTRSYDGHYRVTAINGNKFTVDATFTQHELLGSWEVVPKRETGLVFDNMVVGVNATAADKLEIMCSSHNLQTGDEVQISGTRGADGVFRVSSTDTDSFVLDTPFFTGEAANLRAFKRRGLILGRSDSVQTPSLGLPEPRVGKAWARTLQAWVRSSATVPPEGTLVQDQARGTRLFLNHAGKGAFSIRMLDGTSLAVEDPGPAVGSDWVHYAGIVEYDPTKRSQSRSLRG